MSVQFHGNDRERNAKALTLKHAPRVRALRPPNTFRFRERKQVVPPLSIFFFFLSLSFYFSRQWRGRWEIWRKKGAAGKTLFKGGRRGNFSETEERSACAIPSRGTWRGGVKMKKTKTSRGSPSGIRKLCALVIGHVKGRNSDKRDRNDLRKRRNTRMKNIPVLWIASLRDISG